jgi:hypothetical protein
LTISERGLAIEHAARVKFQAMHVQLSANLGKSRTLAFPPCSVAQIAAEELSGASHASHGSLLHAAGLQYELRAMQSL